MFGTYIFFKIFKGIIGNIFDVYFIIFCVSGIINIFNSTLSLLRITRGGYSKRVIRGSSSGGYMQIIYESKFLIHHWHNTRL